MRLADDDRGRVPFALLGVVLLVGSATLSATMASRPGPVDELPVDEAIDRITANSRTALQQATKDASRNAAQRPLLEPANTSYGRVINESTPFRDALRIRIYLSVRAALAQTSTEVGDVQASASMAETPNASALRRAKQRVHVTRVTANESETAIRVRIDGITTTVRREGQVVERMTDSLTVVVTTPVLLLHDRVEAYEERLNRGPLNRGPGFGLGARLSARLYAVGWARGYAQYGGAPIENVIGNRHVEIAANGAILKTQRALFGRSDGRGRLATTKATGRVAVTDLLVGASIHGEKRLNQLLKTDSPIPRQRQVSIPRVTAPRSSTPPTMTVAVNETVDRAFVRFVGDETGNGSLTDVLDTAYTADATLIESVQQIRREERPPADRPAKDWSLTDERTQTAVRVENISTSPLSPPPSWDRLAGYSRRVTKEHTVVRRWRNGNRTRQTRQRLTDVYRVRVGVLGRPTNGRWSRRRGIETVYERGGPFDGPNFEHVPERAVRRLVTNRGGPSVLARRAVDDSIDERVRTIQGKQPSDLRRWTYADLATLRERVRNVSVTVPRDAVGTPSSNPSAALAAKLRSKRDELVGAPTTYGSVADRARIGARAAYVDQVIARLERRADQSQTTRQRLGTALNDADFVSSEQLKSVGETRTQIKREFRRRTTEDGASEGAVLSVDGNPSYLSLTAADTQQLPSVRENRTFYSLVARNRNLFAAPYGDAADTITAALPEGHDETRVDLRTAALALRAANQTVAHTENETLRRRRTRLQRAVSGSLDDVKRDVQMTLRNETPELSASERRAAVETGMAQWDTTATRALAVANGSAARTIVTAVSERRPPNQRSAQRRDWLELQVEFELASAIRAQRVRVSETLVDESTTTKRRVVRKAKRKAIKGGVSRAGDAIQNRWFGKTMATVPSGLPVVPVPGYWYATMNVWQVDVGGTYARFSVTASYGTPSEPGAAMTYSRSDETVALDVTGDGSSERLGRSTRLSFETWTAVVVVVPPNGKGVGDTDGNADERSTGWPRSGTE